MRRYTFKNKLHETYWEHLRSLNMTTSYSCTMVGGGNIEIPSSESDVLMFCVLSKTISIPNTFLVWLNKPGVSRIVISRTPMNFSRPLSISKSLEPSTWCLKSIYENPCTLDYHLHAAIKQKSSNHTESPLPFTPTPPTSPPHPKKRSQFIVQLSNSHHFFFTLHGDSHHQGTQMAEMWHGPSTAACQRPLQHLAARALRQLLAVEATTWGQKLCQVGSRLFFFVGTTARKSTQSILSVVFLLFVE